MPQQPHREPAARDRRWLQEYLRRFGYLDPDDLERALARPESDDARLRDAIARFQRLRRLPVTGDVDDLTASIMERPRCGNPDLTFNAITRLFAADDLGAWPSRRISFAVDPNNAPALPAGTLARVVQQAFDIWTGAVPFDFVQRPIGQANIFIAFRRGDHGDNVPDGSLDGRPGGVFGHGYGPAHPSLAGQAHLDADERWFLNPGDDGSADLLSILAHEIGHTLGLPHETSDRQSIMAPDFRLAEIRRQLSAGDEQRIQDLYQNLT